MIYGLFGNKKFRQNFCIQSKTSEALIHRREVIVGRRVEENVSSALSPLPVIHRDSARDSAL